MILILLIIAAACLLCVFSDAIAFTFKACLIGLACLWVWHAVATSEPTDYGHAVATWLLTAH